jgi:hypothetical protein
MKENMSLSTWKNKELVLKINKEEGYFLVTVYIEDEEVHGVDESFSGAVYDLAETLKLGGL